jgi:DNA helicase-2/ATP-dependent DNA helicase PcrA
MLAFNSAAALQMDLRTRQMLQFGAVDHRVRAPTCRTFHAVGLDCVRRYASRLGLKQNFTIHDRAASLRLLEDILARQGRTNIPDAEKCLDIYSYRANTVEQLKMVLSKRYREYEHLKSELGVVFRAYDQAKRENNVLDFDDLLVFWHRLLKDSKICRRVGARFDYLLVDEYQDTNPLQDRILRKLRPDGRGLVLVGDDHQCIYRFRGATPENILRRLNDGQVLKLTLSQRSTQPILDTCNAVIADSPGSPKKNLRSQKQGGSKPILTEVANEQAQIRFVIDRVQKAGDDGFSSDDQAVLARTGAELDALASQLRQLNIPYRRIGGDRLLDLPGVKAAVAILGWCENPDDVIIAARAFEMVFSLPCGEAGQITGTIRERLSKKSLRRWRPKNVKTPRWNKFAALVAGLDSLPWERQIQRVCNWLREHAPEVAPREKDARKLMRRAKNFCSRAEFVAAASLQADDVVPIAGRKNRLTIATIHSAKGLEWEAVYILNAVDNCIPVRQTGGREVGPEAVEEERRVLFVGMTRAKRHLELFVPRRLRRIGGGSIGLSRTPFVPKRLLPLFEVQTANLRSRHSSKSVQSPSGASRHVRLRFRLRPTAKSAQPANPP